MKTRFLIFMLTAASFLASPLPADAKPERIMIKNRKVKDAQAAAKGNLRQINTAAIKDPNAKRAIREILNYMDLQAKN